jgi:hypothetical protein
VSGSTYAPEGSTGTVGDAGGRSEVETVEECSRTIAPIAMATEIKMAATLSRCFLCNFIGTPSGNSFNR